MQHDDKRSALNHRTHTDIVSVYRSTVKRRLSQIDLAIQGHYDVANFPVGNGRIGNDPTDLVKWKAALRSAWKDYKRATNAAPEVAAYRRCVERKPSATPIDTGHTVWPAQVDHSKHKEYIRATKRLGDVMCRNF